MNMQTKNCAVEIDGHAGVLIVGTDGDVDLNAALCAEIEECLEALTGDDNVWVIIVAGGIENMFLPKYSQDELQALFKSIVESDASYADDDDIKPLPLDSINRFIWESKKPTIAAITGMCLGGALEFALCFDYRVAQSGSYMIGLHEASRGMFPGAGGTQRLARMLGYAKAFQLIMSAELLPPHRAAQAGTVNEVTPPGQALARAKELAALWTEQSHPLGMANIKELVHIAADTPLESGLKLERNRFMNQMKTWKFGGKPNG